MYAIRSYYAPGARMVFGSNVYPLAINTLVIVQPPKFTLVEPALRNNFV